MKQLVLATRNKGKVIELQQLLPHWSLLSFDDIGFNDIIPEPFNTFRENALIKAQVVNRYCGLPTLSDDSGLCIAALHGAPGVASAHYAGAPVSAVRNIHAVLENMQGAHDRSAFFNSVLCLVTDAEVHYFEGKCQGRIDFEPQGTSGFGYDPIFIPDGYDKTFGQLPTDIKNKLSHRAKAVASLLHYLKQLP